MIEALLAAKAVLSKVPPWVWEALAALILAAALFVTGVLWLARHDAEIRDQTGKYYEGREAIATAAWERKLTATNARLERATSNAEMQAAQLRAELAKAQQDGQAARAAAEAERKRNVTPAANRDCQLHAGVILQFNTSAARANGVDPANDPATASARAFAVDAASGISLDTYVAAVDGTQGALGACRAQVIGWQKYWSTILEPWINDTIAALTTDPKGATTP